MMQLNDTTTYRTRQHLTLSERIEIQTLHRTGHSNCSIARILGRSHATINNEMKRGIVDQVKKVNGKDILQKIYFAETGQTVYAKHREASRPHYKILSIQPFLEYAKQKILVDKWSPDVVVGYVKRHKLFPAHECICTRTLHRYIDENLLAITNMDLLLKLRRKTKSKAQRVRKRILGQSIDDRSEEVNNRLTFGHWEIDTVIGKKDKEEAVSKTIQAMSINNQYFTSLFKSITSVNGSEFAGLSEAVMVISEVYFTDPYSSWERGTNENYNGIIRRFIPKGISIKTITEGTIKKIAHWMNDSPRKKLHYRTPTEVFYDYFNQIQLT